MPRHLRSFTSDERSDMKAKRAEGWSCREIASRFGIAESSAQWVCRGIVCPVNHVALRGNKNIGLYNAARTERLLSLKDEARQMRANGSGYRTIAKTLRIGTQRAFNFTHDVPVVSKRGSDGGIATRPRGFEVPGWVPSWLRREYGTIARKSGEEVAASHCRRLKREAAIAIAENPSLAASL